MSFVSRLKHSTFATVAATAVAIGMAGCDIDDGPLEQAGADLDETLEQSQQSIDEAMSTVEESMQDFDQTTEDVMNDASQDLEALSSEVKKVAEQAKASTNAGSGQ